MKALVALTQGTSTLQRYLLLLAQCRVAASSGGTLTQQLHSQPCSCSSSDVGSTGKRSVSVAATAVQGVPDSLPGQPTHHTCSTGTASLSSSSSKRVTSDGSSPAGGSSSSPLSASIRSISAAAASSDEDAAAAAPNSSTATVTVTSSDTSSSSIDTTTSSASTSGTPQQQQPRRLSLLSNMLAAATERLEAAPAPAPATVLSPLQPLMDSGLQQHKTTLLPPFTPDAEQRRMLDKATAVIQRLRSRGYSAFIVGGWVRDIYLQRRPADIDIATSARPQTVRAIFNGDPMVNLPRSTVKLTHQGEVFELSFFKGISRTSTLFSLGMDAVCRDFTLNALYYDPATNEVLDFVGGVQDAQSATLRLTHDDVKRLTDDPLRVLRGVRFATTLRLKLAPGTALAMKQHAHMCSLDAGVPPRRIWLELRKLAKAEAQQPGAWPHALRLSYHLGLLHHLFPWLKQQPQGQGQYIVRNSSTSSGTSSSNSSSMASSRQVLDPFGHGVSTVGVSSSSSGSSSSDSGGSAARAVLVSERLSRLWRQHQEQQEGGAAAAGSLPLALLVAAAVHPTLEGFAQAEPYLQQLLREPQEQECVQLLKAAARLLWGEYNPNSSSARSSSSSSSSSSGSSGGSSGVSSWAELYQSPHAPAVIMVLSCWMPEALAAGFLRQHLAHVAAAAQQQQRQQQQPPNTASTARSADLVAALSALGSRQQSS